MVHVNNVLDTSELPPMDVNVGLIHAVPYKCCKRMAHAKIVLCMLGNKVMEQGVVQILVVKDRDF